MAAMSTDYTLQPRGEIDIATAGELRDQWLSAIAQHQPNTVIFDLSQVTFLDSIGLGLIIGVHRRQRARGGSVAIINASPLILKMLHITGLHLVMDVQGTPSQDEVAQGTDVETRGGQAPREPPALETRGGQASAL